MTAGVSFGARSWPRSASTCGKPSTHGLLSLVLTPLKRAHGRNMMRQDACVLCSQLRNPPGQHTL
jgi:hypothetical protein